MRGGESHLVFALAATYALSGCALLSRSRPVEVRWFSPESLGTTAARKPAAPGLLGDALGPAGTRKLALGRVNSSALLRSRIVFRRSAVELGTYEDLKWTDYPETYVRHALLHALYETSRFAQASGPGVPILDVDVIEFEESRRGASRSGRVQMAYELRDGDRIVSSGVVTAERPASADIAEVVRAIAAAMDDATTQLADKALDTLASPSGAVAHQAR